MKGDIEKAMGWSRPAPTSVGYESFVTGTLNLGALDFDSLDFGILDFGILDFGILDFEGKRIERAKKARDQCRIIAPEKWKHLHVNGM
jgi:hypothetical protein